jgi:hypothetical protein
MNYAPNVSYFQTDRRQVLLVRRVLGYGNQMWISQLESAQKRPRLSLRVLQRNLQRAFPIGSYRSESHILIYVDYEQNTVELPDDSPFGIDTLLRYLYTKKPFNKILHESPSPSTVPEVLAVVSSADK